MEKRRRLSEERLDAAVRAVLSRTQADQIILFGSAARGEMTDRSDIDMLALQDSASQDAGALDGWTEHCKPAAADLDVLVRTRADAEAGRRIAGDVRLPALRDGRTVYVRPAAEALETDADKGAANRMGSTPCEPEKSRQFLMSAMEDLDTARRANFDVPKCKSIQSAMELSLKALICAQGHDVAHTHGLNSLWDQAEQGGGAIAASRNRELLDALTRYAGPARYDSPRIEDSERDAKEGILLAENVFNHAQARVPALAAETRRRIRLTARGGGAGAGRGNEKSKGPEVE